MEIVSVGPVDLNYSLTRSDTMQSKNISDEAFVYDPGGETWHGGGYRQQYLLVDTLSSASGVGTYGFDLDESGSQGVGLATHELLFSNFMEFDDVFFTGTPDPSITLPEDQSRFTSTDHFLHGTSNVGSGSFSVDAGGDTPAGGTVSFDSGGVYESRVHVSLQRAAGGQTWDRSGDALQRNESHSRFFSSLDGDYGRDGSHGVGRISGTMSSTFVDEYSSGVVYVGPWEVSTEAFVLDKTVDNGFDKQVTSSYTATRTRKGVRYLFGCLGEQENKKRCQVPIWVSG